MNDYLDGELSATDCSELEEQLRRCPDYRQLLASLRQTISLLHHLEDEPPPLPPALKERLSDATTLSGKTTSMTVMCNE